MHQDLSNLLQPGPSAIPSAPHQLQYVSSGLLPFWYLAVQAKKSGNKWSNAGGNGGFTYPTYYS